jgi:hypothetical protein
MQGFTISEMGRESGVNPETIRYYERTGLFAAPPRSAVGRMSLRRYPTFGIFHENKRRKALRFSDLRKYQLHAAVVGWVRSASTTHRCA